MPENNTMQAKQGDCHTTFLTLFVIWTPTST